MFNRRSETGRSTTDRLLSLQCVELNRKLMTETKEHNNPPPKNLETVKLRAYE